MWLFSKKHIHNVSFEEYETSNALYSKHENLKKAM